MHDLTLLALVGCALHLGPMPLPQVAVVQVRGGPLEGGAALEMEIWRHLRLAGVDTTGGEVRIAISPPLESPLARTAGLTQAWNSAWTVTLEHSAGCRAQWRWIFPYSSDEDGLEPREYARSAAATRARAALADQIVTSLGEMRECLSPTIKVPR